VLPAVTTAVDVWVEPLGRTVSMMLEERIAEVTLGVVDAPVAAVEAVETAGTMAVEAADCAGVFEVEGEGFWEGS
jgi:hypothetical protein